MDTHKAAIETEQGCLNPINTMADFPRIILRVRGNKDRECLKKENPQRYVTLNSVMGARVKRNKDLVIQRTLKQTHVQH